MAYLVSFFIFLFGLTIGSFLNCLVWRVYSGESINGRSYCPRCRHQIRWYDNIPVLSYFILGGKCRDCSERISWQYPVVELVTGLLFVLVFINNFQFPISNFQTIINFQTLLDAKYLIFDTLFSWFIISVMITIFIFDCRWYIIPDAITLPAIGISILYQLFFNFHNWQNLAISGIIGLGFFLVQYLVSRGKWIGGGDLRLGLLMGLCLGWPDVLAAIILSYFLGSIVAIYLLAAKKREMGGKVPLGTFLAVGTIAVLLWGEGIIAWYLDFAVL